MKKQLLLILSLVLCCTVSYCQIDSYTREVSTSGYKIYRNTKNILKDTKQVLPKGSDNTNITAFEYEDLFSYNKAFNEAFNETRLAELTKNIKNVNFTFYLKDDGRILEMNITIPNKADRRDELSNKELSSLEKAVRKFVKLRPLYEPEKGTNYIFYVQQVRLERVLVDKPVHD